MTIKTYTKHSGTKQTPQTEKIPGSDQIKNSAGGYGWGLDDWKRLDRFLILGSEGGSYYAKERKLTVDNAEAVIRCIKADGERVVKRVTEVSVRNLAPKNDPAIFVLAAASALGNERARFLAFEALPQVCRIGTHVFAFAEARQAFGGWGRGMRRAIRNWYLSKDVNALALQLAKYQQRNGWTHRDLLRLSHPSSKDETVNKLFGWAAGKVAPSDTGHDLVKAMASAMLPGITTGGIVKLIGDYGLTREMVPTEHLSDKSVQWALLQKQPLHALIRNLGNYSKSKLLLPMSEAEKFVVARLSDAEALKKARVHPFAVLLAARTYAYGAGYLGGGTWTVCSKVVDALDDAFYAAFENVEPTGKNHLLGIDVSGSMSSSFGGSPITAAEAAAAMAMVALKTEPACYAHGFAGDFVDLKLSPKMRLDDVLRVTAQSNFGSTDCALPMLYATKHKINVDLFAVYTDNETWAGRVHPKQALDQYRQTMGKDARVIVCGLVSNGFTIADPNDAGMLDAVGMDASLPQIMRSFALGEV